MTDFTSALFLGLHHPHHHLPSWSRLTLGTPASLREPPEARAVASTVALRQATGAGLLFRSTLHALLDLFSLVPAPGGIVLIDEAAYPIAQWATLRCVERGIPVAAFHHRDHRHAAALIGRSGRRPVLVSDGWCGGCLQPAPLGELQAVAAAAGGLLIVDDSLAFGLVGEAPGVRAPLGRGGMGTLRWWGRGHGATTPADSSSVLSPPGSICGD